MLSALLLVAYMSILTGPTSLMASDYHFIKLVRQVFSSTLPRRLKAYTPCVIMYQLTIELVMMRFNQRDTSKLERSCPMQKFMSAACRDTRVVEHECIADDLQRRLWHTGFWGATGIGRWSKHMVQTQVLGGLYWQNKLCVEQIVAWASLT